MVCIWPKLILTLNSWISMITSCCNFRYSLWRNDDVRQLWHVLSWGILFLSLHYHLPSAVFTFNIRKAIKRKLTYTTKSNPWNYQYFSVDFYVVIQLTCNSKIIVLCCWTFTWRFCFSLWYLELVVLPKDLAWNLIQKQNKTYLCRKLREITKWILFKIGECLLRMWGWVWRSDVFLNFKLLTTRFEWGLIHSSSGMIRTLGRKTWFKSVKSL